MGDSNTNPYRPVLVVLAALLACSSLVVQLSSSASANGLERCISLAKEAKNAEWKNEQGEELPFPGSETDSRGFARVLSSARLEDDKVYRNVLETHPRWAAHGNIFGIFKLKLPLGAKYFRAKVGFLEGATHTDGVDFCFYVNNILYKVVHDTYDGALKEIEVDVSGYAGQEVEIKLHVYAGASSGQDWAVWVDPAIWCYPPSISLSVSPSTVTVEQGGQAVYQVAVSSEYVEEVGLSLSGRPSGSAYTFTPLKGSGEFTSVLIVQIPASTPPGTYYLTIRASGDGAVKTRKVKLIVKAAGSFTLNLNPHSLRVPQGGEAESTVLVVPVGGFNQPVTISLVEAPSGVTATLASTTVNPGESTTIRVEVSEGVEPGNYTLEVRGVYGDKEYTATLNIEVIAVGFSITVSPEAISIE
ncbi:MAG: hypothetical protein DRK00_04370, partial [Thermoprotei archaeon]